VIIKATNLTVLTANSKLKSRLPPHKAETRSLKLELTLMPMENKNMISPNKNKGSKD
jgi:hypothetical protein